MESVSTSFALQTFQQPTGPCVCLLPRPGFDGIVPYAERETAERQDGEGWETGRGGREGEKAAIMQTVWLPREAGQQMDTRPCLASSRSTALTNQPIWVSWGL